MGDKPDPAEEELESFIREMNEELDEERKHIAQQERALRRILLVVLTSIALLILVASLSGCGGETTECRPDFVGPPAPEQAHLPLCQE